MSIQPPPSFTTRPATLDDADTIAEITTSHMSQFNPQAKLDPAFVRQILSHPSINLNTHSRLVTNADNLPVGVAFLQKLRNQDSNLRLHASTRAGHEGQGIGSYFIHWSLDQIESAKKTIPPERRISLTTNINGQDQLSRQLLEKYHFQPIRHFWTMAIDMGPTPPEPAPIHTADHQSPLTLTTFAQLDHSHTLRDVYNASQDAFQDHWGHISPDDPDEDFTLWQKFMATGNNYDPNLWFIALDGSDIAGLSLCRLRGEQHPDMGWVTNLAVRPPWRRRGLGRALLIHSFRALHTLGQQKVALGVDADSITGATRLYEKAGMKPIDQSDTYELEIRPGLEISRQA
ncbi:MAG TPA: GNAT family N-acetyltransferase [Anaerolineae bacterium]|nr:GNAT family N-acetyltransferase [Anaerolineae bacterium]